MTAPSEEAGKRLRRSRVLAGVWAVLVFAASSWPNPPTPPDLPGLPGLDKLTHLALYGVLGFLLFRSIQWPGRSGFALGRVLTVAGVLVVFGTLDEVHQLWIPGRGMEGADLLADVAGGIVGAALATLGTKPSS